MAEAGRLLGIRAQTQVRAALRALMLASQAVIICQAAAQSTTEFYTLGTGTYSCANWLSRPEYERDGAEWIFGYWSGLNLLNVENHAVGSRSDGAAILGETRKICLTEPSTRLPDAVNHVYHQFQQAGK
jgi:hypothetical protein